MKSTPVLPGRFSSILRFYRSVALHTEKPQQINFREATRRILSFKTLDPSRNSLLIFLIQAVSLFSVINLDIIIDDPACVGVDIV